MTAALAAPMTANAALCAASVPSALVIASPAIEPPILVFNCLFDVIKCCDLLKSSQNLINFFSMRHFHNQNL
jgi:hypothetical protein